ncbi:hypothetical protein [Tautonia sociabilis]|uniref:Uncharacterized protein n=1 Tax=Tautonia sociabilis TaxID=2080755 RepID=A0A432MQ78_9BACT|nr:hypothetical protein [Tautonia sociabilis]RUL89297.1 hypothetical protein TsocGM_02435 [Tautonia sociabilis]
MNVLLLGYLGPDTMLPVASAFATVVGVAMMLGRNSTRFVRLAVVSIVRSVRGRSVRNPR